MNTLRTLLERFSRDKIIKRKLTVCGESIPILVSPDAQLKYWKFGSNAFDQDLINIAETYLTDKSTVWDVGANVGVFTFAASSVACNGTVVSIEADIWLANILRKTATLKEYSENAISVVPVAISNEHSIASFMVAERGRASNALENAGGRSQMGGVRENQYVPTVTLDSLLKVFPPPDFVKLDIEGAEYSAVLGAKRLINDIRPQFYIEVGSEVSNQLLDVFLSAGYSCFDSSSNKLTDSCPPNMLFLPRDHENS